MFTLLILRYQNRTDSQMLFIEPCLISHYSHRRVSKMLSGELCSTAMFPSHLVEEVGFSFVGVVFSIAADYLLARAWPAGQMVSILTPNSQRLLRETRTVRVGPQDCVVSASRWVKTSRPSTLTHTLFRIRESPGSISTSCCVSFSISLVTKRLFSSMARMNPATEFSP
jgi:hypothetical protein